MHRYGGRSSSSPRPSAPGSAPWACRSTSRWSAPTGTPRLRRRQLPDIDPTLDVWLSHLSPARTRRCRLATATSSASAPTCGTATARRCGSRPTCSTPGRAEAGSTAGYRLRRCRATARSSWSAPAARPGSPRCPTARARSTSPATARADRATPHAHLDGAGALRRRRARSSATGSTCSDRCTVDGWPTRSDGPERTSARARRRPRGGDVRRGHDELPRLPAHPRRWRRRTACSTTCSTRGAGRWRPGSQRRSCWSPVSA